jgi:hypothetical protein
MNKPLWLGLSAAMLSCVGCFHAPEKRAEVAAPTETVQTPPVTKDFVTSYKNCPRVIETLDKELDREAQQSQLSSVPRQEVQVQKKK